MKQKEFLNGKLYANFANPVTKLIRFVKVYYDTETPWYILLDLYTYPKTKANLIWGRLGAKEGGL